MPKKDVIKKIRVMYTVESLGLAGLELVVMRLSNGLNAQQFQPYICSMEGNSEDALTLLSSQIKTYTLAASSGDIGKILRLTKILLKEKIDVVHSHGWGSLPVTYVAARLAGIKSIFHYEHGRESIHPIFSKKRLFAGKFIYPKVKKIICVSAELREFLTKTFNIDRSVVEVVANGVTPSEFSGPEGRLIARESLGLSSECMVLGTVAIPRPVKNLGFLLLVIRALIDEGKKVYLVHIGADLSGEQITQLKFEAERLGIGKYLKFLGRRTDVRDLLPAFDIYVNCSEFEGMSCSILEAMASSLPIVASRVGGTPEIVSDDLNGYLFTPNDVISCVEKLTTLITNSDLRREFGAASRREIEDKFNLRRQIEIMENLYLQKNC